MALLSWLGLVLLVLLGYCGGAVVGKQGFCGTSGKDLTPSLLETITVLLLWGCAIVARLLFLGRWEAVGAWFILSFGSGVFLGRIARKTAQRRARLPAGRPSSKPVSRNPCRALCKEYVEAIGAFQSRILLGIFYFVIVLPFGIAVRIFSDPLDLRIGIRSSNWISRNGGTDDSLGGATRQY